MNLHVAYGAYMATGEGLSVWIAVANTPERAKELWEKLMDPYFHPVLEGVIPLSELDTRWRQHIPEPVWLMDDEERPAHFEWSSHYYFNAS